MKQLLTIKEAAALVKRDRSRIYAWIDQHRLRSFETDEGLKVRAVDVQRTAADTRRGRPRD